MCLLLLTSLTSPLLMTVNMCHKGITISTLMVHTMYLRCWSPHLCWSLAPSSGRYALCRSIRAGTVSVWNLTRRRFTCRPVRVEHGLYSSTDVMLAHDFKLYIFTDRSRNSSMDPSYRFQVRLCLKYSFLDSSSHLESGCSVGCELDGTLDYSV